MGIINKTIYSQETVDMATVFNYFAHPGRIQITFLVLTHGELTLGQIQQHLGLSQAATSDQVRILRDAGLIQGEPVGTSMRYSINQENWVFMKQLSEAFWQAMGEM